MTRFIIEPTENNAEANFILRDTVENWFFPTDTKREAEFLCEHLNKITTPSTRHKGTVEDYFHEWADSIQELSDKEVELINLKEVYREKEQEIIVNTDFKELYGANNEKVRKHHIEKTLQAMTDAKHDLEISIDYLKRRIDFIKNLMNMQRSLIESGVLE